MQDGLLEKASQRHSVLILIFSIRGYLMKKLE